MGECIDHNLSALPKLLRIYRKRNDVIRSWLLYFAAKRMADASRHYVNKMKREEPPTERIEASKWLNPDISGM
jgi:ABC-type uncharacterized transport system permease subunit